MGGTITALEVQQHNKERVNVHLDGAFAFGLAALEAARLRKGQYLTDGEIAALKSQDIVEQTYERAVRFLAQRPRSADEIRRHLTDKLSKPGKADKPRRAAKTRRRGKVGKFDDANEADEADLSDEVSEISRLSETNEADVADEASKSVDKAAIEEALERLEAQGYLDDRAFARYWLANRQQFRPRGSRALRFELREKGVPPGVIDEVLADFDSGDAAYQAALDKARRFRGLDKRAFREKMGSYLTRRGFDYDTIRDVIDRLINEFEDEGSAVIAPSSTDLDDIEE